MRLVDSRRARYLVGASLLTVLVGGCGSKPALVVDAAQLGVAPAAQPRMTVNPVDGAAGVSPTENVTASVIGGQLTGVLLVGPDGKPVAGQLSPDGERWTSSLPLKPATAYTLKAASRAPSGEETTTVARFRTLAPGQNVTGRMTPDDDGPVPVNQVVSVVFDKPIADRPAVERAFRVTANPAATGKTQWKSDRELVWRPTPAWAPGSQVTVSLDIYGKQLGGNLVGAADLRRSFSVIDDDRGLALRAARSSVPSSSGGSSSSGSSPAPNPGSAPARPDKLPAKPLAEPSTTPTTSAARPRTTTRSATPSTAPKPGATQPSAGPPTTSKPSSSSGSTSGTAGSGQ